MYRVRSRMTLPDEPYRPLECTICNTFRHGVFTCEDLQCEAVICYSCMGQMAKTGTDHVHSSFVMRDLPHRNCLPSSGRECAACNTGQAYSHCSRCRAGVRDGQLLYECKDCMRIFDQCTVTLCVACFKEIGHQVEAPNHKWISFRIRTDKTKDDQMCTLHCLQCDRYYPSWNQQLYAKHAHSKWEIILGPLEAEKWRKNNFESCPVKHHQQPEDKPVSSGFQMTCGWCGKGTRFQDSHFCGKCVVEFCNHCKKAGFVDHIHPLVTLKTTVRTAPKDYWKVIAKEEEFSRTCDGCKDTFAEHLEGYMQCSRCKDYDFCMDCIGKGKGDFDTHKCGGLQQSLWHFYNVEGVDEEYINAQDERARKAKNELRSISRTSASNNGSASSLRANTRSTSPASDRMQNHLPAAQRTSNREPTLPVRTLPSTSRYTSSMVPPYMLPQPPRNGRRHQALEAISAGVTTGAINAMGGSNSFSGAGMGAFGGPNPWAMQAQGMHFMAAAQQNMWSNAFAGSAGLGFDPTGGMMGAGLGGMGMGVDPTGGMMGMMGMGMFGGFGL